MKYVGASAKLLLFSVGILNHIVCTMKITIIIIFGKFIMELLNIRNYVSKFSVDVFSFRRAKIIMEE